VRAHGPWFLAQTHSLRPLDFRVFRLGEQRKERGKKKKRGRAGQEAKRLRARRADGPSFLLGRID